MILYHNAIPGLNTLIFCVDSVFRFFSLCLINFHDLYLLHDIISFIARYIVVCFPFQASSMCNVSRARKVIVSLFLLMLALNFHFLWTAQIVVEVSLRRSFIFLNKGSKVLTTRSSRRSVDIYVKVSCNLSSFFMVLKCT